MRLGRLRLRLLAVILATVLPGTLHALDGCYVPFGATYTINEHSTCNRVTNSSPTGSTIFVPLRSAAEWNTGGNAFLNALPPGVTISNCAACGDTNNCGPSGGGGGGSGSQSFTTAGTFNFVVPCYSTLTVEVWGAGGSGGGYCGAGVSGSAGGASSWDGAVIANGGGGGVANSSGGAGGAGTGGTTNLTGQNGENFMAGFTPSGKGGDGANGGPGGPRTTTGATYRNGNPGSPPGGGGGGGIVCGRGCNWFPGGGGGGYSSRTYSAGAYSVGSNVAISVGEGGASNGCNSFGGAGAVGRVTITWN